MKSAVAAVLLFTLTVTAVACDDEGSAGPDASLTMEDIVTNPNGLVGDEVAVSAEVADVFRPYAFTLKSGEGTSVLVVSPELVRVVKASVVRVIGNVVPTPLTSEQVPNDVAAFVQHVAGDGYRHAILTSQIETLEEPGDF